jgi:hypothetical protein
MKTATAKTAKTVTTAADSLAALPIDGFAGAVRNAWTTGAAAVRTLSIALYAATGRKDVKGFTGAAGKGAFAWFTSTGIGAVSKGRFSQYVTYGRWIDAAERIGKPALIASEYDARALQSAFGKSESKDPAAFLSGHDRKSIDALVAASVKSGKSGKGRKDSDADGEESTPSGRKNAVTARGLADAIGDMVAAALGRKDVTADDREMLREALIAAADLCE